MVVLSSVHIAAVARYRKAALHEARGAQVIHDAEMPGGVGGVSALENISILFVLATKPWGRFTNKL